MSRDDYDPEIEPEDAEAEEPPVFGVAIDDDENDDEQV